MQKKFMAMKILLFVLAISYATQGSLVVQSDVPVAKFRVSNSAILLPLRVKKFSNLLPLRILEIDMISSGRFKKV